MSKIMELRNKDSLSFLILSRLIKTKHYTKKDIKNIKDNLAISLSTIYLIASLVLLVLMSALFVFMHISSEGHFTAKYGAYAFAGLLFLLTGTFISSVLIIASRFVKSDKKAVILIRIAADVLFFACANYMLMAMYSDAQKGYTTVTETLSASIIIIAVLLLIQPMYWLDAALLDISTTIIMIVLAVFCAQVHGMKAMHYYIIFASIFPFGCYAIIALLFYAESQKYRETLENERLHNRAYYDALTHCKNRHALNEFLRDNKSRWENKENVNLLIVLFDIDDFRLYNNQFSHLGGDYCLKSICDAVRREFVSPNLDFFRYGGEEFLLFFELDDPSKAPVILKKVRGAISTLDITAPEGAPKHNVTISIGGLLMKNIKSFVFEEEMKMVDEYLYKAKANGKDAVCYNGSIIK